MQDPETETIFAARRGHGDGEQPDGATPWWRDAVIYQVYIRSFADASGDGVGDIAGIRSRLAHIRALGVDAIWINPWYPSPMADAGYDVSDYRDIDPVFGTLAEAEALIGECHAHGIRVIADIVPNHTSSAHRWFREALSSPPGSRERSRYWFRPGRGAHGELPPNDWRSQFGGSAWTRVAARDGTPGEWYLHLFASEQPDLNWNSEDVREEFDRILRFWFDRGIDGFRIDVAHGLVKDPALPDLGARAGRDEDAGPVDTAGHPFWDQDGVHEIFRRWRRVADAYPGERAFVAEAWVTDPARLALYVRPDELQTAFNFDYLMSPWEPEELRAQIDATLAGLAGVGAPATWVLSNHDVVRHVTRFGASDRGRDPWVAEGRSGVAIDVERGSRRARAAALLMLALPGGAYVYQGEELGLPEVLDIPADRIQDPGFARTGRTRDGCRVPLPWSGGAPPFGFTSGTGAEPWLPQPASWAALTVAAEERADDSMLALYRQALALRRATPALGDGELCWDAGARPGVLSFTRGPGFRCVVNLAAEPLSLAGLGAVLLSSEPISGPSLPVDAAAWLVHPPARADARDVASRDVRSS